MGRVASARLYFFFSVSTGRTLKKYRSDPVFQKEDGFLFHPLTETDLPIIWERQNALHVLSSEFDAFRLWAWLPLDHTKISYWNHQFALRCQVGNEVWYVAPGETEDYFGLLHSLMDYERSQGGTVFRFFCVDRNPADFPPEFTASPRRDLFDYLYRAEDLVTLKGRDYAAKRNQISQFKRKYDWRFEPLSSANADGALQVLNAWDAAHEGGLVDYERIAIDRMLRFSRPMGQSGVLLFADGEPAAFAIGSHPRRELLDVLAEKALPQYTGAYPMIMHTYAQYAYSLAPFDYINREEDMGLANLREAKLQLKPDRLIEKTLMVATL